MTYNTLKGAFGYMRKSSSRISLRSPRRLIRDGTLRLHSIYAEADLLKTEKKNT